MQTNCILSATIFIPVRVSLCVLRLFMCFYQNLVIVAEYHMLIVDKHRSDIRRDEFPMPQIDRKSKQAKEQ